MASVQIICFSDRPVPECVPIDDEYDSDRTDALVERLWRGGVGLVQHGIDIANVQRGYYSQVSTNELLRVAAHRDLAYVVGPAVNATYPSTLDRRFLEAGRGRWTTLYAGSTELEWYAFALWDPRGNLRRSLSLRDTVPRIIEQVGPPLRFEDEYWTGERSVRVDGNGDRRPFTAYDLASEAYLRLLAADQFQQRTFGLYQRLDPEVPWLGTVIVDPEVPAEVW